MNRDIFQLISLYVLRQTFADVSEGLEGVNVSGAANFLSQMQCDGSDICSYVKADHASAYNALDTRM